MPGILLLWTDQATEYQFLALSNARTFDRLAAETDSYQVLRSQVRRAIYYSTISRSLQKIDSSHPFPYSKIVFQDGQPYSESTGGQQV